MQIFFVRVKFFAAAFFAVALSLAFAPAVSAAGWVTQTSGTGSNLEEVFCINVNTCWAVGAGNMILKTTDRGANWIAQTPSGLPTAFYDVHFINANTGWAVGASGVILKTVNGGASWTAQTSGTPNTLYGVYFSDANNGWAVGASRTVRLTNDGGASWRAPDLGSGLANVTIYSVHFPVDNDDGWASAGGGFVKQSTIRGDGWTDQEPIPGAPTLYDIQMIDNNTGYAVGSNGTIIKTTSGGTGLSPAWTTQEGNASGVSFYDVHFRDINKGIAVGDAGLVRRTVNAGSSWLSDPTGSSANLRGVYFVDRNNGWAVGSSGTVLYYDGVSPSVGMTTTTSATAGTPVTFSMAYADAGGVDECLLVVDNANGGAMTLTAPGGTSGEASRSYTFSSAGTYGVRASCTDRAGNTAQGATVNVTVAAAPPSDMTPPDTTITSSPAASTTATSATFEFSANETATFQCSLDGSAFASCTSPKSYSGLAVGSHTFQVSATDSAGNTDPTPASYSWTITATPPPADTTAPSAPTGLMRTTPVTDNTPTFTWTAATDNVGVTDYEGRFDDEAYTSVGNVTSYTVPQALEDRTWTLSVRARDAAGNTGPAATLTFSIDATAPAVGPISPTSATVGTIVTFSASFSDAVGVTDCELWVDGFNQGAMTPSGPATGGTATRTHNFTLSGAHPAYARCLDAAGNEGLGSAVTVSVVSSGTPAGADTTAPSTPTNLTLTSAADDTTPTFTWFIATDNVGVTAYHVQIDSSAFVGLGPATSYTTPQLSVGDHTIGVRAADGAGNVSSIATLNFTITSSPADSTPTPAPAPTTPSSPSTTSGSGPPFALEQMAADASTVVSGERGSLISALGVAACQMSEAEAIARVDRVFSSIGQAAVRAAIINFTSCGTVSTLHLGAGERLGVVNSYKAAFGRLPATAAHWNDITKISNGRFPGETSKEAELAAKERFRRIYLRSPNMASNQNDKAAVTVMAYGLRPLPRNLNSERAAISIFKGIFSRGPSSATDWDAVRAIAYSGARR